MSSQHSPEPSTGKRSWMRWIAAAAGLAALVVSLAATVEPYRQTVEFHEVMFCEERDGGCFASEATTIAGRRMYTSGTSYKYKTNHYEVTWRRADGTRQTREVDAALYDEAQVGRQATLRLWHGEVVGLEIPGGGKWWFSPRAKDWLSALLHMAFIGLGVLLYSLLYGQWIGWRPLGYRLLCWAVIGYLPVRLATEALTGSVRSSRSLTIETAAALLIAVILGRALINSLPRRRPSR